MAVQGSTLFELIANISHRDLKGHRENFTQIHLRRINLTILAYVDSQEGSDEKGICFETGEVHRVSFL